MFTFILKKAQVNNLKGSLLFHFLSDNLTDYIQ